MQYYDFLSSQQKSGDKRAARPDSFNVPHSVSNQNEDGKQYSVYRHERRHAQIFEGEEHDKDVLDYRKMDDIHKEGRFSQHMKELQRDNAADSLHYRKEYDD